MIKRRPSGRLIVVGVMGGARVSAETQALAESLGAAIARAGYVLLTGGRPAGVMAAASRGARRVDGLVIGVLPGADPDECAEGVDIAVATSLGDGRNLVNVLSADVVIALEGGAGTMSEIALALKNRKPLILLGDAGPLPKGAEGSPLVARAVSVQKAMQLVNRFLQNPPSGK